MDPLFHLPLSPLWKMAGNVSLAKYVILVYPNMGGGFGIEPSNEELSGNRLCKTEIIINIMNCRMIVIAMYVVGVFCGLLEN